MEIPDTEGIPTAVQGMEEAVPAAQAARKRGLSVVLGTGHLVGLAVSEALARVRVRGMRKIRISVPRAIIQGSQDDVG